MNGKTCTSVVLVLPVGAPRITKVQTNAQWETIPFPPGAHFELPAVAMALHVSLKRIYNLVSLHRLRLSDPIYHRKRRLLTAEDVDFLRTHIPVKRKVISR